MLSANEIRKNAAPTGIAALPSNRVPGQRPGRSPHPAQRPGQGPRMRPQPERKPSALDSAPMGAQEPEEEEIPSAEQQKGDYAPNDLQETTRVLQRYFSDRKITDISNRLQALIPVVGPEHSEKIAKVYAKFMESVAVLKATLASMAVLAAPQQEVAKNLRDLMQMPTPMGGGGINPSGGGASPAQQQTLKSGPLT